ncbi:MAG: TetR/AcrR family transcriptional regulator [Spirochaetales bacterium]|nr:TetR/AcrR family transcriptional regulator [Spirochaetales bacterium]
MSDRSSPSKDTKQRILDAASDCFIRYGYEKTSMRDIGKMVGMNKASLYYHFRDKQALFEAFVHSRRAPHNREVRRTLEGCGTGGEAVIAFLCCEIDFVASLALNFLDSGSRGNRGYRSDTSAVFEPIIEEDIAILDELLAREEVSGSRQLAILLLQTARGFLMADCPLDLPSPEREEGYDRIKATLRSAVSLMLKGAGL